MDEINKDLLYQSKFNYYRVLNVWAIVISSFAEITYFISDCQLFGRFAYETLLSRCFVIIPMLIFILINRKVTNYKIMVSLSYITIHSIMWCTIWSIYYLPIKTHASEGFIVMHLMFLAIGLCSPPKYSIFYHSLLITNILSSHLFNHYENLDIMLSLGLPCLIGVELVLVVLDKVYKENYLIKKELEESLYTDQLTKAYNRNIIKKILKENSNNFIFDSAYIFLLDIDFFKKVNDTYGHDKGDEVLKSIANSITKCITNNDYLIRWGGEEFVLIVPEINKKEAMNIAHKIKAKVTNDDNGVCRTTVSIGIAKYKKEDYNNVIKNADKALYISKTTGRNKLTFYEK